MRLKQISVDVGWQHLPVAEILGDGAPWIWHVAEAHFPFPGVRQTLDYHHLSEHLYAVAPLLVPDAPEHAKLWVEGKPAAVFTARVRELRLARLNGTLQAC